MALKITSRDVDGITIVALQGDVVLGEESSSLREKMQGLLAEDKKKLIIDMSEMAFIDSSGLGALVGVHHSVNASGASLRKQVLASTVSQPRRRARCSVSNAVSIWEPRTCGGRR